MNDAIITYINTVVKRIILQKTLTQSKCCVRVLTLFCLDFLDDVFVALVTSN